MFCCGKRLQNILSHCDKLVSLSVSPLHPSAQPSLTTSLHIVYYYEMKCMPQIMHILWTKLLAAISEKLRCTQHKSSQQRRWRRDERKGTRRVAWGARNEKHLFSIYCPFYIIHPRASQRVFIIIVFLPVHSHSGFFPRTQNESDGETLPPQQIKLVPFTICHFL